MIEICKFKISDDAIDLEVELFSSNGEACLDGTIMDNLLGMYIQDHAQYLTNTRTDISGYKSTIDAITMELQFVVPHYDWDDFTGLFNGIYVLIVNGPNGEQQELLTVNMSPFYECLINSFVGLDVSKCDTFDDWDEKKLKKGDCLVNPMVLDTLISGLEYAVKMNNVKSAMEIYEELVCVCSTPCQEVIDEYKPNIILGTDKCIPCLIC